MLVCMGDIYINIYIDEVYQPFSCEAPKTALESKHRIYIKTIYSTGLHAWDTLLIPKCTPLCI